MIRVVVVDDQELVRDGFALILGAQSDIEVVGTAADGVEALAVCREHRPDVVLMDLRMPRLDGLAATPRVLAEVPGARVLVLTTFADDSYVVEALRRGASGFLLKDSPRASLLAAVRSVAEGEVTLDSGVMAALVTAHLAGPRSGEHVAAAARMTAREQDVLRCILRGLNNAETAASLHISETTVKTHVARLLTKWGARDRVGLVVKAHEAGLAT
ncbi:MAG TPA: response regulator transcription factor [Phycicoccus sp.]